MYERLESAREDCVAYRVSKRLSSEEFQEIARSLEAQIEKNGKLKMLLEMQDIDFPSPGVAWQDLKFVYNHSDDFERFAVLGDKAWEKWWVEVAGKMLPIECHYFDVSEKDQAWRWIVRD